MANIEISHRSSPQSIGVTDRRILLRDERKVRTRQRHSFTLVQPRFLPLVLTLVRLWLLCWYPEGFIVKSRHK